MPDLCREVVPAHRRSLRRMAVQMKLASPLVEMVLVIGDLLLRSFDYGFGCGDLRDFAGGYFWIAGFGVVSTKQNALDLSSYCCLAYLVSAHAVHLDVVSP